MFLLMWLLWTLVGSRFTEKYCPSFDGSGAGFSTSPSIWTFVFPPQTRSIARHVVSRSRSLSRAGQLASAAYEWRLMEPWMASGRCEPGASGKRKPGTGRERSKGEKNEDATGGDGAPGSYGVS